MFSYAVTCLIWGDNPNNVFSVLFSKKTSISDIKLKILKILNLNKDLFDNIKYYKVNEELYVDDKRFNIIKDKESYNLISPSQFFEISEVSDKNLIIDCIETERSFNSEDSIGAIIVIDENALKSSNVKQFYSPVETISMKNKYLTKQESKDIFSELRNKFNEDDESYNGDFEDDFSEYDNDQAYKKYNAKSRKEKTKKKITKENKDIIKTKMRNSEKIKCNSLKNESFIENKDTQFNINQKSLTPNDISTSTEDKISINNEKNKLEAITTIQQIIPQSTQFSQIQVNNLFKNKSNTISNNYINYNINKVSSNFYYNIDTSEEKYKISSNKLSKKSTQDITAVAASNKQVIKLINNNELFKETTIEDNFHILNTKDIKVQGTGNKNQNRNSINTNIYDPQVTSSVSNFNIKQNNDTPSKPILNTDSLPVEETILSENESQFIHQTMNTLNYPITSMNKYNNGNNNRCNNFDQSSNKKNENENQYNNNNKIFSRPYSRVYYPNNDIEIMEFSQGLEPSAPLESQISNDITNVKNNNNSNSDLLSVTSTEHSNDKAIITSSVSPKTRPPSISKSIIFGVEQFPTPPENNNELDITVVNQTQQPQSQALRTNNNKHNSAVIHQYYKNDLNDQPPSYENINNHQPSAPNLTDFSSNNTMTALIDSNNHNVEMDVSNSSIEIPNTSITSSESNIKHFSCFPCNTLDSYLSKKLHISIKRIRILKILFILLLLLLSISIVLLLIFLSQPHSSSRQLDYSIYTITRTSTIISGTNTITKTLIHRPVTISEQDFSAEPTSRSITSNTNEEGDLIIESDGKGSDEGSIKWTIKELINPYLVVSYFKKGSDIRNDDLASESFKFGINRIVEINDTINVNDSESYFELKATKGDLNFEFFTINDIKTNIDIFKFSEYFGVDSNKLNVTLNYLFTTQSISTSDPDYAILNPQAARCFLEIENWNYKYDNSKLVIQSNIISADLIWSVKEENVINLNNSEGKIILIDGVKTARIDNTRNATLSLYEDIVEFEEDEGAVNVDFLVSDVQKSKYLLVDFEVLLRSYILDIMTEEYAQSVNSVTSSTSPQYMNYQYSLKKIIFNLPLFNNRFYSIQTLFDSSHLKILSIFISFLIQLIIISI
ncbi:hypothetical protein BCR36DRAFT_360511 [Piromyces finnis]|uniref:Uncharacterized protein n=1 Tax=Piromyces finnis TaxID=1754191 RepID=A0A1Y1V079_9FUNG|nr:hypothetical protein BCR36DRAFT_360511 [Piromyces finnis]|eukprot:ORX43750.1 hypothetical protein BCR36DRAFT_360511 [Piromyces finnis]